MNGRAARRAVALGFALAACIADYWMVRIRGRVTLPQRAMWLNRSCSRVGKALAIHTRVRGSVPAQGLVVSNHLSYLDIVILSAVMPCFFVSKQEVGNWPYFGEAARTGGTIFVNRDSRASAAAAGREIAERLELHIPVLLFPEGTSSDGLQVLRFHASLFEPAVAAGVSITAAAVRYRLGEGREERDLCWYDDTLFLPHLWKALGMAKFSAEVTFGEPQHYPDRRTAARATYDEVVLMREDRVAVSS